MPHAIQSASTAAEVAAGALPAVAAECRKASIVSARVPMLPVRSFRLVQDSHLARGRILCGLNLLAVSEAFVFAGKMGLDVNTMIEITSKGAAGSWALENLGTRMASGDFDPMFMIDLQNKALRIALETAREHAVPLPGTSLVSQLLSANQAAGEGRLGTQAMVKVLQRLAGDRA